jgi:hypothetical protein
MCSTSFVVHEVDSEPRGARLDFLLPLHPL